MADNLTQNLIQPIPRASLYQQKALQQQRAYQAQLQQARRVQQMQQQQLRNRQNLALQQAMMQAAEQRKQLEQQAIKQNEQAVAKQNESLILPYNDPDVINSIVDVFNTHAVKKEFGDATFLSRLKAIGKALDNTIVKPLSKGDWKAAGINTLMGLGETLDVLDNIPKALLTPIFNHDTDKLDYDTAVEAVVKYQSKQYTKVYDWRTQSYKYAIDTAAGRYIWDDKDVEIAQNIVYSGRTVNPYNLTINERLKSAIGIGDYGRINYDYVTGSGFTDFVLEVVTGLWDLGLSKGADAAASAGAKSALKSIDKPTADSLVKAGLQSIDAVQQPNIIKEAMQILKRGKVSVQSVDERQMLNMLTGIAVKTEGVTQDFAIKTLSDALTYTLAKHDLISNVASNTTQVRDVLQRAVTKQVNTMGINIMKATDKAMNAKDTAIKALKYVQFPPAAIYAGTKYLTDFPGVFKWIANNLEQVGKANGTAGVVTKETLEDSQHTLKQVLQTIEDAVEEGLVEADQIPKHVQLMDSMLIDQNAVTEILAKYAKGNIADCIADLNLYFKEAHPGKTIPQLITEMEELYAEEPNVFVQNYLYTLTNVQQYIDSTLAHMHTYKAAQETFSEVLSERALTVPRIIDSQDYLQKHLTATTSEFVEDLVEVDLRVPELIEIAENLQLTKEAHDLKEIPQLVTAMLNPALSDLQISDYITKVYDIIDQVDNVIDANSVDANPKIILDQLANTYIKVLNDTTTVYNAAADVLKIFKDSGDVTEFIKIINSVNANNIADSELLTSYTELMKEARTTLMHYADIMDTQTTYVGKSVDISSFDAFQKDLDKLEKERAALANLTEVDATEAAENLDKVYDAKLHELLYTELAKPETANIAQAILRTEDNMFTSPQIAKQTKRYAEDILDSLETLEQETPQAAKRNAYKDSVRLKVETSAMTDALLNSSSYIEAQDYFTSADGLGQFLAKLSVKPDLAPELQDAIHTLQTAFDAPQAYKLLIQHLQQAPGITFEHFNAIKQSLQYFVNLKASTAYANFENIFSNIITKSNDFLTATQQTHPFTIDYYLHQNAEAINAYRTKLGLSAITKEEHTALSDAVVQEYLWNDLAQKLPELQGKKHLMLDMETLNTTTMSNTNTIWQLGIFNDSIKNELTIKDVPDVPDATFMRKLLNDNTSTYEDLCKKWKQTYLKDSNAADELTLIRQLLTTVFEQAKDTNWNPISKKYDFTLAAHNGNKFDFKLLRSKVAYYKEHNLLLNVPDADILDKVVMQDTLDLWHKAEGYDSISDIEAEQLKPLFQNYFNQMQTNSDNLFSSITYAKLTEITHAIKLLTDKTSEIELGVKSVAYEQDVIINFVDQLRNDLRIATDTNKAYSNFAISLDKIKSTLQVRPKLIEFLTAHNVPVEKAVAHVDYALQGKKFNPSAIFYSTPELYNLGYAYINNNTLVDKFFTDIGTKIPQIKATNTVARTLDNIAQKIDLRSVTPESVAAAKANINWLLTSIANFDPKQAIPEDLAPFKNILSMKFLTNLKISELNGQQTLAVYKYLFSAVYQKDPKTFANTYLKALDTPTKTNTMLLLSSNNVNSATRVTERWATTLFNGDYDEYTAIEGIYREVMDSVKSLDAASTAFENADLATAAKHAQVLALEPTINLITIMKNYSNQLLQTNDLVGMQKFSKALYDLRVRLGNTVTHYALQDEDTLIQWLGSSGGFIILDDAELVRTLNTKSLASKNIKVNQIGKDYIIYLTKDSKFCQYMAKAEDGTDTVLYNINGIEYSRFNWAVDDFQDIGNLKDVAGLNEALTTASRRTAFISNGAAAATTYESMNIDELYRVRQKLPKDILKDMVDLPDVIAFQNNEFNHTVLGSPELVQAWLGFSSSDPIKMLCSTNINLTKAQHALTTYTTSMLSSANSLANTQLGQLIQSDLKAASTWFTQHPEYTLAQLVVDNKYKAGYRIMKYKAGNLEAAVANGAHLIPTNVYDKIYKVINTGASSNTFVRLYTKVLQMYKIGYLMPFKTSLNNIRDAFLKTILSENVTPNILLREWINAAKIHHDFNDITEKLIEQMPKDLPMQRYIKSKYVQDWFKSNNFNLDYKTYLRYYNFMQESVAGGEIAALSNYSKKKQISWLQHLSSEYSIDTDELVTKTARDNVRDKLVNKALMGMNYTEDIARIAQFNIASKKGLSFTKALQNISQTQFNYENKSRFERNMEFIIPFFTFQSRNLTYWMDMFEKNPGYLETLQDVLAPLIDISQYDPEELEKNHALQQTVLSGGISTNDPNTFINTNLSFLDTFNLLTNPLNELKDSAFFPIKNVIDVMLQGASDAAYHTGQDILSSWMQTYFNTKPTEAQLQAKYGEWYAEYKKLHANKVSSENYGTMLLNKFKTVQNIPLIGTALNYFMRTGMYFADDALKGIGYATGATKQTFRFDEENMYLSRNKLYDKLACILEHDAEGARGVWKTLCDARNMDPNTNVYSIDFKIFQNMLQEFKKHYDSTKGDIAQILQSDDDNVYLYTRLKWELGYGDTSLAELPYYVRETIINMFKAPIDEDDGVIKIMQDGETVMQLWKNAEIENDIDTLPWEQVPTATVNKIYQDVARACVLLADIHNMLDKDEIARYTYAVAKKKLGYGDLKSNQIPTDSLELIRHAMLHRLYVPRQQHSFAGSPRPAGTRTQSHKPYPVTTPRQLSYKFDKQLWANYAHNNAHKFRHNIYRKQYLNSMKKPGTINQFRNRVSTKISPTELKYRIKDMHYYLP